MGGGVGGSRRRASTEGGGMPPGKKNFLSAVRLLSSALHPHLGGKKSIVLDENITQSQPSRSRMNIREGTDSYPSPYIDYAGVDNRETCLGG